MKKTFQTIRIGKKLIPVAAAAGILFSLAPVGEYKPQALGAATVLDVGITGAGILANILDTVGLKIESSRPDWADYTGRYAENISYVAPTFKSGEFHISVYHTKMDSNFTRAIKILYPDGTSEIKTLKSGQQVKITEAGTIVDLQPYADSPAGHNLLYITQAQLDEGKTGVALNQAIDIYVEKKSSINLELLDYFYEKRGYNTHLKNGVRAVTEQQQIDRISNEEERLVRLTSQPVGREVLSNYATNNAAALADFNKRKNDIFGDTTKSLETSIKLPFSELNHGKSYQIIPYKKGTNKVLVKTGSQYLSGKEGNKLQYSDSLGDDNVFELVKIDGNSVVDNKVQFRLVNKNGVSLAGNLNIHGFATDFSFRSEITFPTKTNNEVNDWLIDWYPGKEQEKQTNDGAKFEHDKNDTSLWTAYDASGKLITNNWIKRGDSHYFAGSDGILLKGWQEIGGNTYYFNPKSNQMALPNTSDARIDGKGYHFNDSGVLQRSAWNGEEYSDASGAFVKQGLQEIEGKVYYFKDFAVTKNELRLEDQNVILYFSDKGVLERASNLNGEPVTDRSLVNLDGDFKKTLLFEGNGSFAKMGVSEKRDHAISDPYGGPSSQKPAITYYSLEDGYDYSGWKMIDGKSYHFKDGFHFTFNGHETIDGKKYYFNNEGQANITGIQQINDKIYYFNDKGEMQTGWQTVDGKTYYFKSSGEAQTGIFTGPIEYNFPNYGYWKYYGQKDGSIAKNKTFDVEHDVRGYDTYEANEKGHITRKG